MKPLLFQYQQRGPDLAAKLQDPDGFKRFHEQRDQDLENYLANLHSGSRVSVIGWNASDVVGGGFLDGTPVAPDWVLGGFTGGYGGTTGAATWDADPFTLCIITYQIVFAPEADCTLGFAWIQDNADVVHSPGGTLVVGGVGDSGAKGRLTLTGAGLGLAGGVAAVNDGSILQYTATPLDLNLALDGGGALGFPDKIKLVAASLSLYVVD